MAIIGLIFATLTPIQFSASAVEIIPAIAESDYPYVAGLARAQVLAGAPLSNNQIKVNYRIEPGVPAANEKLIKENVSNFVKYFDPELSYSSDPLEIIVYKTIAGGKELASTLSDYYQKTVTSYFKNGAVDPANFECMPMRAVTFGGKRLIFYEAPCETKVATTAVFDPVLAPHELTHAVQSAINKGFGCRESGSAIWLCEGQANVVGSVFALNEGADYWKTGRSQMWSAFIPKDRPRTIEDLKVMESETDPNKGVKLTDKSQVLSEYYAGAALSEYLIAWGGLSNSLRIQQLSYASQSGIYGFRDAFQAIYGISISTFYEQALPYVNYVANNPDQTDTTSAAATKFVSERMPKKIIVATVKVTPTKVAPTKKTITCVKGKLTKKVTAVNPTCPSGYKKK